jgi:hypothetical protein
LNKNKKVKRLLVIKPNKISLVDYKTKMLIKTQRMTDLKSWFSGDGYYNLTPMFLLNSQTNSSHQNQDLHDATNANRGDNANTSFSYGNTNQASGGGGSSDNLFLRLLQFRFDSKSIDMDKLFVIEFRDCKWHLQIDDFQSLKSITCILLDQSLDMGIDSNPLMLDLTISEHYQNKYNIFSPGFASFSRNTNRNIFSTHATHYSSHFSNLNNKKPKNSAFVYSGAHNSKADQTNSVQQQHPGASISLNINNRNQSANFIEPDSESTATVHSNVGLGVSGATGLTPTAAPPVSSLFPNGSNQVNNQRMHTSNAQPLNSFYSSNKQQNIAYKYELEFQQLQLMLLWFPEEVAIRLTEVEYELFKQVPPIEYLRHATLDMNNFKTVNLSSNNSDSRKSKLKNDLTEEVSHAEVGAAPVVYTKSVQDLIVRYKEVSSWIKKLIQSQPTADKRLSIILSAIRCAITCWNIGNFNSSREIWLGLK